MAFKPTSFHCRVAGVTFKNDDGTSRQEILETYNGEKYTVVIKRALFEGETCYPVYICDRDDNMLHQVGYVPKKQIPEFETFMSVSNSKKVFSKSEIVQGSTVYGMRLEYSGEQEIIEEPVNKDRLFCVIIGGSRTFTDYKALKQHCDYMLQNKRKVVVITSCAHGAGQLAIKYAKERKLPVKLCPANWDAYGKQAAFKRNETMVSLADGLISFGDSESPDVKHLISLARKSGLKVSIKTVEKEVTP